MRSAVLYASMKLVGSALPVPAMSKPVPWPTDVLMNGKPRVMLTVLREVHRFYRDEPLVVIHGDIRVAINLVKQSIRGKGTFNMYGKRPGSGHGFPDPFLFISNDPLFARVGVQAAHLDAWGFDSGNTLSKKHR